MTDELTPGMEAVIEKIRKLLALAANNSNEAERASATEKASALLVQYNLDASLIEQQQGRVDGKRENAAVDGGFYLYQRELYQAVAELNFCMYFLEYYWAERTRTIKRHYRTYEKGSKVKRIRHRIIGRMVNTAATRAMAGYIEQSIERAIRERLTKSDGTVDYGQLFSNWGISYREGAVQRLVEKITERRRQVLHDEKLKAKADEARAKMAGASTSTAVTLSSLIKSEEAANYDFKHGDGAWARKLKDEAEDAKWWKNELARRARLAKSDPEAYAKEEAARRKAYRSSGRTPKERNKDWSAYHSGYDKADGISIDPQVSTKIAGLIR